MWFTNTGQIPVVQLNYAAMSFESPYDRDTVENCVREILGAVQRAIGSKRNVELNFAGIGKLSIRDSRVKMKFYKDFINQMDGSGKLLDSMQNVSQLYLVYCIVWRLRLISAELCYSFIHNKNACFLHLSLFFFLFFSGRENWTRYVLDSNLHLFLYLFKNKSSNL